MFSSIERLIVMIPALPLAAALVTPIVGKKWLKERSHWPVLVCIVAAFLCSLRLLSLVAEGSENLGAGGFERTVTIA